MEETGDSKLVPRDEEEIVNDNDETKAPSDEEEGEDVFDSSEEDEDIDEDEDEARKCKKASLSTMMTKMKTQEQVFPKKKKT